LFIYLIKGAVISSDATPDKNKLSTDTLSYSDIKNKADYSASSTGVNIETTITNKVKDVNGQKTIVSESGITGSPDISIPVSGSASSTTKSAIANGTIQVRSGNTDLSNLSRNTTDAVNALGKIFDKKKVQEQQELIKIFGQEAFKTIGDVALKQYQKALDDADAAEKAGNTAAYNEAIARANSWNDGGTNKILLHAVAGGIMSSLGGGNFTSGAAGAGLNEAVQNELAKIKDKGLHQLVSAAIGAAASKLVGGNAQTGASAASYGTKYNWLSHFEQMKFTALLKKALDSGDRDEIINIIAFYTAKSSDNYKFDDLAFDSYNLENLSLMRDNEIIEGRLYEQLIRVIDINTTASLNPTLNELSTTIYGQKAADRANSYKDILNNNSNYDPFATPPEVELELNSEFYNAKVANEKAAKEAEREASPGDYAYKYDNAKIVGYYPDGTAAVHLEDGDHPAYNAPQKGEVLADDPDAQFTKINGAWYVIDPENAEKCWYTSKEPSTWQTVKQTTGAVIENVVATNKENINQYNTWLSQRENESAIQMARVILTAQGIDPDDPANAQILADEAETDKIMNRQAMDGVTGSVGGVRVKGLEILAGKELEAVDIIKGKGLGKAELNVPGTKYYNPNYKANMSAEDLVWGAKDSGKGLSTMGSSTRADAMEAGKSWVGPDYKTITNSSGEVIGYSSQDGMRAFRISYKPKEGITRANFQENTIQDAQRFGKYQGESKVEIKNVHVDIVD